MRFGCNAVIRFTFVTEILWLKTSTKKWKLNTLQLFKTSEYEVDLYSYFT